MSAVIYALEVVLALFFVVGVVDQIALPLLNGEPLFPGFRPSGKRVDAARDELREEGLVEEAEKLEKELAAKRAKRGGTGGEQ